MDDGELDFSNNHEVFPCPNMSGELQNNGFFDELPPFSFGDYDVCNHVHNCNATGRDNASHTHTCFHVHTKIVSSASEDKAGTDDTAESGEKKSKKRPMGNREAVRKYREKKKMKAASLEDEVIRLRAVNQQLMKRLAGQAALEAEISRLKCLLVDIRGRIEGEIGTFPYQKPANQSLPNPNIPGAYMMNPCNRQCDDQIYCLHPGMDGNCGDGAVMNGQNFTSCDFESLQCLANQDGGSKELLGCGLGNGVSNVNSSGTTNKRKGGARTAAN